MDFDKWYEEEARRSHISVKEDMRVCWDAAINEAIGAAWNADDGGDEAGSAALSRAEENMEKLKQ